ncbi:MAG: erythromycin biosynthesis sensory transduction protein eryC1 [Spirochaetes bacterium RBG_16_49_21]|nr:MAG: erythromycin biosynthesis sensory transduction protein eryC1 [Spirochaetes bacterium RBG_16_49_21]
MIKFLDLKDQYYRIKGEIDSAIHDVIESSAFIGGKFVKDFEAAFAGLQGCRHCIGVANGTDAIEIAIEAMGLPRGSEIIVPANSFIATSEAVTRSGHRVVFCDCGPGNYTISVSDLAQKITPRTSAVIPVHLYGHPADMDEIIRIARSNNMKVIEDSAQAHCAEYRSRRVGSIGDMGIFSFYPGKNLGAYGDGGAIVTGNDALAAKCRMIANHGRIEKYNHEFEGRNSRLDGIQAAVLNVKMRHLEEWTEKRIALAARYHTNLRDCTEIVLPRCESWARHVYHLYVIRTRCRDELAQSLKNGGIETGIHYPIALPRLKAYQYLKTPISEMNAIAYDREILSLPMGDHLSMNDIDEISGRILDFFNNAATTSKDRY